jgi:hypothetical protein
VVAFRIHTPPQKMGAPGPSQLGTGDRTRLLYPPTTTVDPAGVAAVFTFTT